MHRFSYAFIVAGFFLSTPIHADQNRCAQSHDLLQSRVQELESQLKTLAKKVETLEKAPKPSPARAAPKAQEKAYVIVAGDAPIRGLREAPITLTVFTDFQCPYCSRIEPFLMELISSPKALAKVRVVYKNYPLAFHRTARPSAKAALAARAQGGDAQAPAQGGDAEAAAQGAAGLAEGEGAGPAVQHARQVQPGQA